MMRALSGRIALGATLALCMLGASAPARAVLLTVPSYKQCDSAWGSDPLGTCSETMCSAGCAVTSTSMVFEYFGGTQDPGELNACLTSNGGYASGCLIYWSNNCMPNGVSYDGTGGDIDTALANGYPVIAYVTSSQTSMHFVVIIGNNGGEYQIHDPAWNYATISDGGYTIQGLRFYSGNVAVCECSSGDQESRACGFCGTETRSCESGCDWGAWVCQDVGVCHADAEEDCGLCGTRICDQACAWGACDDPCSEDAGAGDGGATTDGGVGQDAAPEGDSGVEPDASSGRLDPRMVSGCACHTTSSGADGFSLVFVLAFALLTVGGLARHRRRSRRSSPAGSTTSGTRFTSSPELRFRA